MKDGRKASFYGVAAAFTAAFALYGLFALLDRGCPFRALFGIPCAGCGMTRAWGALLRLDIRAAFDYHPLFWTLLLIPLSLLVKDKPKARAAFWTALAALFILVYLLRLSSGAIR